MKAAHSNEPHATADMSQSRDKGVTDDQRPQDASVPVEKRTSRELSEDEIQYKPKIRTGFLQTGRLLAGWRSPKMKQEAERMRNQPEECVKTYFHTTGQDRPNEPDNTLNFTDALGRTFEFSCNTCQTPWVGYSTTRIYVT